MQGKTLSNRYRIIQELGSDALSVLYKAEDLNENNRPVTLRFLKEKAKQRPLEILLRFKRTVNQATSLLHPNFLRVYSQEEFEGEDFWVLEYFEGSPLSAILTPAPLEVDDAVDIILQSADALNIIHQQGLLHQTVQPASILLKQGKETTVKLTNFGLSILLDISRVNDPEQIVMTFGYMAPESTGILRKPVDSRSDIYSLGILFYRLVTGRLPYQADDVATLIHQHIAQKPLSPSSLNEKTPAVIENIILRLISKEPQERYQSLAGLIVDLKEYQKQRQEGKTIIDFEIARSDRLARISFSSRLIGRDEEMSRLNNMLGQAKEGMGSLCFVFGEPGIGKSRLVDELRGTVHSLGGFFCGGKCYQYEMRTPYKAFSEVVDAYIEKVKRLPAQEQQECVKRIKDALGDMGAELVKIAPNITELIGEPPKPAEIEPAKERIRFLITVTNFLAALGDKSSPLLMFLDDLQWADEGTLDILARLAEKAQSNALLMIASYRDTEVSSSHPLAQLILRLKQQATPISEMQIKAFGVNETALMISQILLEKDDSVLPLARAVHSKTNGNPFFSLELLHTLVDEGIIFLKDSHYIYDLDKLKGAVLPENVVDIVLKRVSDIPAQDLKILSYASVMGKEMQFELLARLTQKSSEVVLNAIEDGIQNQLLMRDLTGRENIFFMHDRIREVFYKRVPEEERIPLHQQIGVALEEQHKDAPERVLYDLAYHFTQGHVQDKALKYLIPAAKKAQDAYANSLAIGLYTDARLILESQGMIKSNEYIEVLENLGLVYRYSGKFDTSLEVLQTCQSAIPASDKLRRSRVMASMGDAYFEKGDNINTVKSLEAASAGLGFRIPGKMGVNMGIPKEFLVLMLHTWLPKVFIGRKKADPVSVAVIKLIIRLSYVYYFVDTDKMFYLYLVAVNMAERIDSRLDLARIYVNAPAIWSTFPWFSRAFMDGNKAVTIAKEVGDRIQEGRSYAYLAIGCKAANRPKEGLEYGQKSVELLKGMGEYWDLGVAYTFINHCNWLMGTSLVATEKVRQECLAVMKEAGALQPLGWTLFMNGMIQATGGVIDDAVMKDTLEGYRLMQETHDNANFLWFTAYLGFIYEKLGRHEDAIRYIEKAAELYPTHNNKACWVYDMFPIGAQVYLNILSADPDIAKEKKDLYFKRANFFIKRSFSLAQKYRYITGWYYQVNGTYLWLCGNKKKAVQIWEEGVKFLREKTHNKYRLACLLLEQARFFLKDNPNNRKAYEYLIEAREVFDNMVCKSDLETVNKLLENITPEGAALDSRQVLTQKRHLDSLLSVTQAIGSIFILDDLLARILEYGLKVTGAERGFLLLHEGKDSGLKLKVSHGLESGLQGLSFSYDNYKLSLGLISEVEKGQSAVIADQENAPSAKIAQELKSFQVRQVIAIPLMTREKFLGVLYMDNLLAGGMFGKDELELMKSFAVQASVSIENAFLISSLVEQERLKQEMELGREIQMALLPKTSPEVQGLKVNGLMMPAKEIGGDYYDFVPIPVKQKLAVIIGDVSGKGVAAGLLMSMVKATIHTLAQEEDSPRHILLRTNQMLHQNIGAQKFMTLLYFIWDPQSKMLTYSSAGHEHIIIYRASNLAMEIVQSGGFMLGMIPSIEDFLEDRNIELHPQDKVILYTDGVTEARDTKEELFTLKRLTDIVFKYGHKPAEELLGIIKQEVYSFIGTRDQYDDITLVVMEAT